MVLFVNFSIGFYRKQNVGGYVESKGVKDKQFCRRKVPDCVVKLLSAEIHLKFAFIFFFSLHNQRFLNDSMLFSWTDCFSIT